MSGLTIGYFSIDSLRLKLIECDPEKTDKDRKKAKKVIPILKNHHYLLVALLVTNAAAMEALPIFLEGLMPPLYSIILSVSVVLVFGEIVPQAICTNDPLRIGASMVPFVRVLMFILTPIVWPISKLLDAILHKEEEPEYIFTRSELSTLVGLQAKEGHCITREEAMLIQAILEYGHGCDHSGQSIGSAQCPDCLQSTAVAAAAAASTTKDAVVVAPLLVPPVPVPILPARPVASVGPVPPGVPETIRSLLSVLRQTNRGKAANVQRFNHPAAPPAAASASAYVTRPSRAVSDCSAGPGSFIAYSPSTKPSTQLVMEEAMSMSSSRRGGGGGGKTQGSGGGVLSFGSFGVSPRLTSAAAASAASAGHSSGVDAVFEPPLAPSATASVTITAQTSHVVTVGGYQRLPDDDH